MFSLVVVVVGGAGVVLGLVVIEDVIGAIVVICLFVDNGDVDDIGFAKVVTYWIKLAVTSCIHGM